MDIDRSAWDTYEDCPRKFYFSRVFTLPGALTAGIQPVQGNVHFEVGSAVHEGFQTLVLAAGVVQPSGKPTEIAAAEVAYEQAFDACRALELPDVKAQEYALLAYFQVLMFGTRVLPAILADYTILAVEEELYVKVGGHRLWLKPDLVVQHKQTGEIGYLEWKTASGFSPNYLDSWFYSVQVQLGAAAVRDHYGRCDWVQVVGFNKGTEKQGIRYSPFCNAYLGPNNAWSATYVRGWNRVSVMDLCALLQQPLHVYFLQLPDEVLDEQLTMTAPIYIRDGLVASMLSTMERELDAVMTSTVIDDYRPCYSHCRPSYGMACQFLKICHGVLQGPKALLDLGFEVRVAHHAFKEPTHESQ